MFWLILLIVVAALCALVLFFVAPAAGRKELRTPFAGRNFAHRGYFGKDQRPPENSLPAFAAAVQNGYGMEMDVQFSSDRKLLVFHDDTLTRMTGTKGWVRDYPYDQICQMPLKGSAEHAPLFSEFLQTVDGKTPLIIEIKSRHEYTGEYLDALCHATLDGLKGYNGPYCIESFDPRVVKRIRKFAPQLQGPRSQLLVLIAIVAVLSAFVKNIGALAIMIPVAVQMARKQFLANPRFAQQQDGKFRFGHDVEFAQQFQQLWTLSDDFCVTRLSGQRGGRFLTEPSRPQAAVLFFDSCHPHGGFHHQCQTCQIVMG